MFKLILIAILVFLLIRMIVSGFYAFFAGATEESIQNPERKREGEVTIEAKPKIEKRINKDDGQYIDYEEIK